MLLTSTTGTSDLEILLEKSFKYRLIRWLYQSGHPLELRAVLIPEEMFVKEENNPLARANLLLRAMTESELLPLNKFQLSVRVIHYRLSTLHDNDNYLQFSLVVAFDDGHSTNTPPAIEFHTCTTSASVKADVWVQNALRETCQMDDNRLTAFDLWIYGQLILTGYNRL